MVISLTDPSSCFLAVGRAVCDESEYRLTQYLMSNYDPSVRPARNSAEPLEVNFSLSLHHIIDVVSRLEF